MAYSVAYYLNENQVDVRERAIAVHDGDVVSYSETTLEIRINAYPKDGYKFIRWDTNLDFSEETTETDAQAYVSIKNGTITAITAPIVPPGSAYVYTNNQWQLTTPYVYPQANTPKESTAYIYTNGSWHECIG